MNVFSPSVTSFCFLNGSYEKIRVYFYILLKSNLLLFSFFVDILGAV